MNRNQFGDSYTSFPYRVDTADGRTNNGGFDLVSEPWRIDEITEIAAFPELRETLIEINGNGGPWLTLGCEAGYEDGVFLGYIEFSPRQQDAASNESFIAGIDHEFSALIRRRYPDSAEQIIPAIQWEYSPFSYFGSAQRFKVNFYFRALDQRSAGQVLELFRNFLLIELKPPPGTD